jgi:hypothetical protein
MVIGKKPNWLCRLGLHKWRYYGEKVVVTWKEPAYVKGASMHREPPKPIHRQKEVFTKKKCLRCGIRVKRKLVRDSDGTLSSIGWESISKYEEDEYKPKMKQNTTQFFFKI